MERAIAAEQKQHQGSRDQAARIVALREIKARPGAALVRSGRRLAEAWAADWLPLRHHRRGIYGPRPNWWATVFLALSWFAWLVLGTTVVGGVVREPRLNALPVLLVLSAMAGPALTVAMSRQHLPWLVLLLPAAGVAVVTIGERATQKSAFVGLVLLLFLAWLTIPGVLLYHLGP
jgi:hypothetical protein